MNENSFASLAASLEGKGPLGRPRQRWEDDVK
jgi:hypothetical protein